MKKLLGILLALTMLLSLVTPAAAEEADTTDFAASFAAAEDSRPGTRYWISSADKDYDEVEQDLTDIAAAGYGIVEIIYIVDGDSDQSSDDYAWGTDAWNDLMDHILTTCDALGMEVDMTIGPRWPAGAPDIGFEEAAKQLAYEMITLDDTSVSDGVATLPVHEGNTNELIAVVLAKATGETSTGDTETWLGGWSGEEMSVTPLYTELAEDCLYDVTPTAEDGSVDQEATAVTLPEGVDVADGQWLLFTFYSEMTGETVSAGPNEQYLVIDHYSLEGTNAIISLWEDSLLTDVMQEYLSEHDTTDIFEDSIELSTSSGGFFGGSALLPWTNDLLATFEEAYGYDLTLYLPLLINRTHTYFSGFAEQYELDSDVGAGISNDYVSLINDLYISEHVTVIADWAEELNMTYRVQAYSGMDSGYYNTNEAATIENVLIEGESLAFQQRGTEGYDSWRILSGGAHVVGNQLISNEMGAFSQLTYRTTFAYFVEALHQNIAGGANRFVVHGYPSDIEGLDADSWPGWHPFGTGAADAWEENQPVWESFSILTDYIARLQFVTQAGLAQLDIAVYNNEYRVQVDLFDNDALCDYGYSYEFLSDAAMEIATVEDGILSADSAGYKALIIEGQKALTMDALEIITAYAEAGLPIYFVTMLPETCADGDMLDEGKNETVAAGISDLIASYDNVSYLEDVADLAATLAADGITPDAQYSEAASIMPVHRTDGNIEYYWLYNESDETISQDITFLGTGNPYFLNAWTGEVTGIAAYTATEDSVTFHVTLEPGEAKVFAISTDELAATGDLTVTDTAVSAMYDEDGSIIVRVYESGDQTVTLSDGTETVVSGPAGDAIDLSGESWELSIEKWSAGDDANTTLKTELAAYEGALAAWTEISGIDGLDNTTSGTGVYDLTFTLSETTTYTLSLAVAGGDYAGTCAVTSVVINGTTIPTLDQTTLSADIGDYLVEGENTISITIATTLANAMTFTDYQNGLASVTLTPYTQVILP